MKNTISAVILAIGIGSAGYLIGSGFVNAHTPLRTVMVKGLAEKKVKADQGQWTIRYKTVNQELDGLYQNIESSESKIRLFLHEQGFTNLEIAIQPQTINDSQGNSYSSNSNAPRYSADGAIAVFTTKVNNLLASSQKIGSLVKNGVVITGTNMLFRFTKLNTIKPEMLLKATTNARKAGQTFAKQSMSKLGDIKTARQGLFTITDANSSYANNDINKKVRVVSTLTFFLN